MRNLVNWICLISVMFLVIQVMVQMSKETIADLNNLKYKNNKTNKRRVNIGKTSVSNINTYYQEKIAK